MFTNRLRKYLWLLFLVWLILTFAILAGCDPSTGSSNGSSGSALRTEGNNEVKRWSSTVYVGPSSSPTLPVFTGDGWHLLNSGDAISTSSTGEAELNLAACWPGRLYVFWNSQFRVATCRKAEAASSSLTCVPNGTLYAGTCAAAYSVDTFSARVTILGTSFSITYVPEHEELREITLVIALEGAVYVEPVEDTVSDRLGPPIPVRQEMFLFTMPDHLLRDVAGVRPREARPLAELPAVIEMLGIEDWYQGVEEQARVDGVLPPSWRSVPDEPGRPPTTGVMLALVGGPFNDMRVQRASLMAVPWTRLLEEHFPNEDVPVIVTSGRQTLDAREIGYNPEEAAALLDEAGYPVRDALGGFRFVGVNVLVPEEDEQLVDLARRISEHLFAFPIFIDNWPQPIPAAALEAQVDTHVAAGEGVIVLSRP